MSNALKKAMIPILATASMLGGMPYGTMEEQARLRHSGPTVTPSTERGYTHPPKTPAERAHQKFLRQQRKLRKQKGHKHGGARK